MGCGASKNKIHVAGATTPRDNSAKLSARERRRSKKLEEVEQSKETTWASKRTDSLFGSRDSLGGSVRGGSAVSKASKHSMDSGFGDKDDLKYIGENSDPNVVRKIEDEFNTPRKADSLFLVGKPIEQRRSANERERLEEKRVMASLRDEGLITRPMSRAAGGLSFAIVADGPQDSFMKSRPPPRLAKLEKRKKKKKLTEADLEAKLEKAKLRREKLEQQRLEQIKQVSHQSNVQNALTQFAQSQMEKDESMKSKEEIAAENREKKLRALQEKLQEKKRHAEEVRKRKNLTISTNPNSPPSSAGSRKFREKDSIVASGGMS